MKITRVLVNDLMQTGYEYLLSEPEGKNFHPGFNPELTPRQMLEMGRHEKTCCASTPTLFGSRPFCRGCHGEF
ncbi:MAG: hypothetical protein JW808_03835 [Victivallales bacterium]|nr:hypothetical protein [Victivallales bacterium]